MQLERRAHDDASLARARRRALTLRSTDISVEPTTPTAATLFAAAGHTAGTMRRQHVVPGIRLFGSVSACVVACMMCSLLASTAAAAGSASYYQVLDLDSSASEKDIKKAYRKLALK